jgi:hypothetical protein
MSTRSAPAETPAKSWRGSVSKVRPPHTRARLLQSMTATPSTPSSATMRSAAAKSAPCVGASRRLSRADARSTRARQSAKRSRSSVSARASWSLGSGAPPEANAQTSRASAAAPSAHFFISWSYSFPGFFRPYFSIFL